MSVVCYTFITASGADYEKRKSQRYIKGMCLDEFVISSSVKETNNLKNMPTAVSVVSLSMQNTQIESLPDLSSYIPNFFILLMVQKCQLLFILEVLVHG